jgi:hypothetical protein
MHGVRDSLPRVSASSDSLSRVPSKTWRGITWSPELLAALAVVVLVPTAVVLGSLGDVERLARYSLSIIGAGLAISAPTALGLVWVIGAGLAESAVGADQTLAGYLSAASLLPFGLLVLAFLRAGPKLHQAATIWLLFVVVTALSSPLSPLPRGVLLQRFVGLFDCLGVALLVSSIGSRGKQLLAAALMIVIAAHATLGIAQYIGQFDGFDAGDGVYRVAGAFGWSTTLGYLLALGMPFAFALAIGATGYRRILPAVCGIVMAVGLVLTFSRTSVVAAVVGCLLVALGVGRVPLRGLIGLGFGTASVTAIAALTGIDLTARFLYGTSVLEFATLNGRTVAWNALAEQGVTLFGHGLFAARDLLDQLLSGAIAPHNLYLESLYDFGVVGAALLIWLHATLLWNLARLATLSGPERYLALGAIGAVSASLLHGLTGSELWHFSVGVYFFLIAFLPLTGAALPRGWLRRPA